MIETLPERVNGDEALVRRGRYLTTWQKFWSIRPPPGSNDLLALIKRRALKAEGNLQIFMSHLRYFKEALAKLRAQGAVA